MSETKPLHVKPARPGLVVRRPESKARLPAEGGKVPRTPYWRRRLAKGDVVETKPAARPKAAPRTAEPES